MARTLHSVASALDVLDVLAAHEELGVSAVAREVGVAKSSAHRLLTTLVGHGLVEQNPETGHYGSVTPTREGTSASGRYCREFQHTIYVDGEQQQAYGTACRQPDGSWEVN